MAEEATFQPVETTDRDGPDEPEPPAGTDQTVEADAVRGAQRDRLPLAGPILEDARNDVLRGVCSSCEARLRVEVEDAGGGPFQVRCPICSHTRIVDP